MIYKIPLIGWIACFVNHFPQHWIPSQEYNGPHASQSDNAYCKICKTERW